MTSGDSDFRPAGITVAVILVVATVMWTVYLVAALRRGSYGVAALDGLLLVGSVWTLTRVLRRRRRRAR